MNKQAKRVVKINLEGKITKEYDSCKKAGSDNYMSTVTVYERCKGKFKNSLGGFDFAYAKDEESIKRALKRLEAEKAGIWVTKTGNTRLRRYGTKN